MNPRIAALAAVLLAPGCSADPPTNEADRNEVEARSQPGSDVPTPRVPERPPPQPPGNADDPADDPNNPCPPGVEVCIPRGEVPEPVNRSR